MPDNKAYAKDPKWYVRIFVVTNDAHFKSNKSVNDFKRKCFEAAMDTNGNKPSTMEQCFLTLRQAPKGRGLCTPHPPSKLRKLMQAGVPSPEGPNPLPTATPTHTAQQLFPATTPLRYQTYKFTYTDGSCIQTDKEGQKIGAGVIMLEQRSKVARLKLLVDPRGKDLTNTITRAELAAIQAALSTVPPTQDIHILTDSLAAIYMLGNKIYRPAKQLGHCSKDILQDIVDLIRSRGLEGSKTTIGKIKAHIGCVGNEMADQAAKSAALGLEDINFECPTDPDPMRGLIWPAIKVETEDGIIKHHLAGNLNKWARDKALDMCFKTTPTKGIYAQAWHTATTTHLDNKYSHRYWDRLPANMARTILRLRWGREYNAKLATKMKLPYAPTGNTDGNCPLCKLPDSCAHMLGGCQHPDIKAMTIKRHNTAVQLLHKATQASELGGCYTLMDAGHLPGELVHTRIPKWMLPDTDDDMRNQLRPDLLLIQGLTQRRANTWPNGKRLRYKNRYTVHLLEVGYGSDTRLHDKECTKMEQHRRLEELLKKAGWKVNYVVIPLGTTGGIHNTLTKTLQRTFKLNKARTDRTCNRLHDMAVHMAHALIRKRRQLEYHNTTPGYRHTHNVAKHERHLVGAVS